MFHTRFVWTQTPESGVRQTPSCQYQSLPPRVLDEIRINPFIAYCFLLFLTVFNLQAVIVINNPHSTVATLAQIVRNTC
jgi:hypothetical protein